MDAIGEYTTALGPEPAHGLEVVTPVPAAADGRREWLPVKDLACGVRLQARTDRDIGRPPPGGGAPAYQVVVPFGHDVGDADLHRPAAQLRRDHRYDLEKRPWHRE